MSVNFKSRIKQIQCLM